MLTLKLPDGSSRQVPPGTRPRDVAESIGKRLAQAAVAAKLDGTVVDLDRELSAEGEATFQILTDRDPEALGVLRHSTAHIMARAVMRLFPGVQLAFGPALENGFYYDIDSPTPIREEDFPRIEDEMRRIIGEAALVQVGDEGVDRVDGAPHQIVAADHGASMEAGKRQGVDIIFGSERCDLPIPNPRAATQTRHEDQRAGVRFPVLRNARNPGFERRARYADRIRAVELVRLRRNERRAPVQTLHRIRCNEDSGLHQAGAHARVAATPERRQNLDSRSGCRVRDERA